mgnify:CR=1 FL=1
MKHLGDSFGITFQLFWRSVLEQFLHLWCAFWSMCFDAFFGCPPWPHFPRFLKPSGLQNELIFANFLSYFWLWAKCENSSLSHAKTMFLRFGGTLSELKSELFPKLVPSSLFGEHFLEICSILGSMWELISGLFWRHLLKFACVFLGLISGAFLGHFRGKTW